MKKIEFLFSGAQNLNLQQLDFNQSLGGYISNTPIPKNLINSLFSSISNFDISHNFTDTIAIFCKNVGDEDITNLSMMQIYESYLGVGQNLCKFEWGFVKPTDDGFIELIGSRKENPFYVEFEHPEFKRENCILKFLSAGLPLDTVDLLGVEFDLTSNTIESLIEDTLLAFKNNVDYTVKKYSDDEIFIERRSELITDDVVELLSPGDASSNQVVISGLDDSVEFSSILKVGEYIGIWIRRSVLDKDGSCDDFNDPDKVEQLEVFFNFN